MENGQNNFATKAALNACHTMLVADNHRAVLEWAEQARSLALAEGNLEFLGDSFYFRSRAQYHSQDLSDEDALDSIQLARSSMREAGVVTKVAKIDDFSASILQALGRHPAAAEALRDCLTFARETGSEREISYALNRYADVLRKQREFDKAEKLHLECREIARRQKFFRRLADSEFGLSICYKNTRKLDEAVEAAYVARALYDYLGLDNYVARCDDTLSDIYWRKEEFNRAIQANRKVISYSETNPDWNWYEYISRTRIAENYYHMKLLDECEKTLDEPHSNQEYEAPIIGLIARLYLRARIASDKGLWTEAKAFAEEAIELTNQDEDHINFRTPWLYEIIGLELERRGDSTAAKFFTEATALHLTFGNDDHAREVAKRLLPKPPLLPEIADNELEEDSPGNVLFD